MTDEVNTTSNNKAYITVLVVNINSNAEYGSASLYTLDLNYCDCPVSQRTDNNDMVIKPIITIYHYPYLFIIASSIIL